MNPFFSIIIPCCDVESYVRDCLDSVLNQPFTDWECLIGVETSKDRTEEIVCAYAARDSRLKVFTGPRSGSCSVSRNTGIDMATGEYVIFLDGDDTIAEGSLQRLHDKIAARPGADLYPCAMLVHNETTGKDEPPRDNYPRDFHGELTGPEATLQEYTYQSSPCPMLQLTVFRRLYLVENGLKCIAGLRRQDSEFTPRARYLAKRVTPLHEPVYFFRIRDNSVSSSKKGNGAFLKDWAIILHSLMAFHASVRNEPGFDPRVSECWARHWLSWLFYFWFSAKSIQSIPRVQRVETLQNLFKDGFGNLEALLATMPEKMRMKAWLVRGFVTHPSIRWGVEWLFRLLSHRA